MFSALFGNGEAEQPPQDMFTRFAIDQAKKYGEGGYGATFAALDKQDGQPCAVKLIDTRRMRIDAIRKECSILEMLQHQNVIRILAHGVGRKEKSQDHIYYIFMEAASGGELFDQVIDRGANAMPEATAKGFMVQLLAGVQCCHLAGVAHRDLKLENVLLTKDGVVKVIDFGLSHVYQKGADGSFDRSMPLTDTCGSKSYAAPEVLRGKGYDGFAADVWSLGVCLFAMLSGFFPLDEASPHDWRFGKLFEAQARGRSTVRTVYGWYKRECTHLTPHAIELMDMMLSIDPSRRLTLEQVLQHPFFMTPEQLAAMSRAQAENGAFNAFQAVDDGDAPAYRAAFVNGPAVVDDMAIDDDEPVYRSIEPEPESMPLPGLMRQQAFGRADDAFRLF